MSVCVCVCVWGAEGSHTYTHTYTHTHTHACRLGTMLQAVKNTLILLKQLALESVAFPELEPLAIRFFPVVKRALHTNTNESACASVLVFVFLWMAQREFRKRPAKCQSGALSPRILLTGAFVGFFSAGDSQGPARDAACQDVWQHRPVIQRD